VTSVERLYAMAKENPTALLLVLACLAIISLYRSERRSFELLTKMTLALGEMGRAVSVAAIISEEQMDYLTEAAPKRASRTRAKVRATLGVTTNDEPIGRAALAAPQGAAPGGAGSVGTVASAADGVPAKAGTAG
jgi:hypothetical protein